MLYSCCKHDERSCYDSIDSCPIEGFEKDKAEEILGLNTKDYEISMFVAFGYRVNPPSKKYRLPIEQLVEYR